MFTERIQRKGGVFVDNRAITTCDSPLLITVAVNVAHLRLFENTGVRLSILLLTVIASLTFFGILIYYEISHSPVELYALAITHTICFISEWVY